MYMCVKSSRTVRSESIEVGGSKQSRLGVLVPLLHRISTRTSNSTRARSEDCSCIAELLFTPGHTIWSRESGITKIPRYYSAFEASSEASTNDDNALSSCSQILVHHRSSLTCPDFFLSPPEFYINRPVTCLRVFLISSLHSDSCKPNLYTASTRHHSLLFTLMGSSSHCICFLCPRIRQPD